MGLIRMETLINGFNFYKRAELNKKQSYLQELILKRELFF